jgi:rubrerythrin
MSAQVKVKLPYVGLLNAIAVGEERGGLLFDAWAGATPDNKLRKTLALVAAREHDHAELFCARLAELGFEVRPAKPDPGFDKLLKVLGSKKGDAEKVAVYERSLRSDGSGGTAPAPPQLDPVTKALFDWYLDEERDSGRRLRKAFARVRPVEEAGAPALTEDECVTLFRRIARAEKVGGQILAAWAGSTKDATLREVLALVAAREAEHARVFRGRLEELGIEVEDRPSAKVDKLVAYYGSKAADCEKATKALPAVSGDSSGLDALEARAKERFGTVEAHLISWFVAEEHDSGAKLRAAYDCAMAGAA